MISGAVLDASCTCAGSELGRCNHVTAVLLLIYKHCKEYGNDAYACTSNKTVSGISENVAPGPREKSVKQHIRQPKQIKLSDFDPRPESMRSANDENLNCFVGAIVERVTTQRTQETIKLRQVYVKDNTAEVKISLRRSLAEHTIEVGKTMKVTFLKLNLHKGEISLQTIPQSTLEVNVI
ncbi:unnamed protein product [Mytilus edulis]|uniref:SWIM-type domain-containing protein n=1 Tax=Mytilus edulis TaxID=6550 RepID=A0A8S3ULI7_MYTED|nr:unnamed protein product [Mytilus edulis]